MKRSFMIISLTLALVMALSGVAMADENGNGNEWNTTGGAVVDWSGTVTDFNVDWSGSNGRLMINSWNDTAQSHFDTRGAELSGRFSGRDSLPSYYHLNNYSATTNATVTDGYIYKETIRTDGHAQGTPTPGQSSLWHVDVDGGTGEMVARDTTSWHNLSGCTYHHGSTSGGVKGLEADADSYYMNRRVTAPSSGTMEVPVDPDDPDSDVETVQASKIAQVQAWGNGHAKLSSMESRVGNNILFGDGGCYSNSWFSATGSGEALWSGVGDSKVKQSGPGIVAYGDGTPGSAQIWTLAQWTQGVSLPNTKTIVE